MLHITNGDDAARLLRASGLGGEVLAWRDVLHEGPIFSHLEHEALSRRRADYIAAMGWDTAAAVRRDFAMRDARLAVSSADHEVVLWFEHDLYDQLQLVQVLAWYARTERRPGRLSLVQAERYLGLLGPSEFPALFEARVRVGTELLDEARRAWRTIGAPEPRGIERWAAATRLRLRHLAPALTRLLEELPSTVNGLGRSEQQLVETLDAAGPLCASEAFRRSHHERETAIYLGDTVFASYAARLAQGPAPLVASDDPASLAAPLADLRRFFRSTLSLAPAAQRVLAGEADWVAEAGVDRWLGGLHLLGREVAWRWDPLRGAIAAAG